ncbi:MAG TPA: DNA primase [Actinomycetota bacterium]
MPRRIVDEDIQQIRERADILDVVSGYTQLRKAGTIHKGLCCFHQEKTPSFTVNPVKGLFYCHGCGVGGDVFAFLRQAEGLTFGEAAERLADRVGISLRYEGSADRSEAGGRRTLLAAARAASEHFQYLLMRSPEAGPARRYIEKRGFTDADARTWGLGYAPGGRDALYRHLLGKGFASKTIVDAGLAMVGDAGEHRDRFRGRLVFPIADLTGDVVAFGARTLGDDQPKYLNSPETSLYHKSKILYALDKAKHEMVKTGSAVVVEGYTDVMGLHRVGFANVVATCGTALGEDHFAMIKRFCDRVILAFDADAAGGLASERGFGIHASVGLEVLVASFPSGQDPADAALGPDGPEVVKAALEEAVPLMRFVVQAELARHRLDTPEARAKAVRAVAKLLVGEPSRVARSQHAFWVARQIGADPNQVMLEIAEAGRPSSPGRIAASQPPRLPGYVKLEREALALLIDEPWHLKETAVVSEEHFTEPQNRVLLRALREQAQKGDSGGLMDRLPDEESRRFAAELALTPVAATGWDEIFSRLEEFRLGRQIAVLRATLDGLDPGRDPDYDTTFEELMRLEGQRRKYDER